MHSMGARWVGSFPLSGSFTGICCWMQKSIRILRSTSTCRSSGKCCRRPSAAMKWEQCWPRRSQEKETIRGHALALRDCAMIELLYAGGVRVSEVADARLEDLKLEMGYILVRGKGDKGRMVPLGVPAQTA